MSSSPGTWWKPALATLAAVGIAIRIRNALEYRMPLGFDAPENWQYIRHLMVSWSLPDPDVGWATAHPPLFYYASAAVARLFESFGASFILVAIPLVSSIAGLIAIAFTVGLVRRLDPEDPKRALIAGGLLLFLPAHIYMSAMLNEEILAASLTSLAVAIAAWQLAGAQLQRNALPWAAAIGLLAGLAFLTKLSGALVVSAIVLAYGIRWLRGEAGSRALACAATVAVIAATVGGWYYVRNLGLYGYLYPQDLEVHGVILEMPPGERNVVDYLRFPLSVWKDPQLLDPDLLRSVWGGTYATFWFDGHRHFLPRSSSGVTVAGVAILALALVPTLAFLIGMARGIRRAISASGVGADLPMLLLIALTLLGYVHFTWQNPYYVCVKASYLLGLSVPFAYYASEVLAGWTNGADLRAGAVWTSLVALAALVTLTFTIGVLFKKLEGPGLDWRGVISTEAAAVAPPSTIPALSRVGG